MKQDKREAALLVVIMCIKALISLSASSVLGSYCCNFISLQCLFYLFISQYLICNIILLFVKIILMKSLLEHVVQNPSDM